MCRVGILPAVKKDYVATPQETVTELLRISGRRYAAPIRRTFVQQGEKGSPRPGPLAALVRNGDRRGLDLYLLLIAVASSPPFNSHRGAGVWARALRHTGTSASEQAVSRIWSRLEAHQLVSRGRHGRLADILLLREDGSGDDYTHPADAREAYFQFPHSYWLDDEKSWSSTLSLPGKAMLLIALSLQSGFRLPVESAKDWYGVSGDTAQRGLKELVDRGALARKFERKKAPLAPKGYTHDIHYTLSRSLAVQRSGGADGN